jgi:hypothetical protein
VDALAAAKIESGSVFSKVDLWGNVSKRALEPSAVNAIAKQRGTLEGLQRGIDHVDLSRIPATATAAFPGHKECRRTPAPGS